MKDKKKLVFLEIKDFAIKKSKKGQLMVIDRKSGKTLSIPEKYVDKVLNNEKFEGWS